ncbi:TRAP transporter substrate-binding protein [Peribacillus aracenensis]|uniref:TRAP transporter substrate-binding protein n=1 Tax=Peribacillus aracenensis TaxID=2976708 RepID=UPI0021A51035|nr:TRAP transporter substrate-binding protein [Peribacillus sp. BBB004]
MEFEKLKKVYLLVLTIMLVFLLAACGGGDQSVSNTSNQSGNNQENAGKKTVTKPVKWVHQSLTPRGHLITEAESYFAEEVEKRTEGRIKFDFYSGGGLGIPQADVLSSVGEGLMQTGQMYGPHVAGDLKIADIMGLPFLIPNELELMRSVKEKLMPYWEKGMGEQFNAIPLAATQIEGRNILTTSKVESLEDFKGLKIRPSGDTDTQLTDAIGGVPTPVDYTEVYTALQQGVLDGAWMVNSATLSNKLYEEAKFALEVDPAGAGIATWFLVVNKDAFYALSKEDQQIVREVAVEAEAKIQQRMREEATKIKKELQEKGVTFYQPSDADIKAMKDAAEPIIDKWESEAGDVGKQMMDVIKEELNN